MYNYKYNGKELQETGMYDYGARMYMPDIGRWGVQDPMSEEFSDWSPYHYVYNNPILYNDPTGMFADCPGGNCPDGVTDIITLPNGQNEVQIEGVNLVGKKKENAALNAVQTTLDVIGIWDPFGIADGVNAGIYLYNGDYTNAGISALGIIPFIGDFGKGYKYGAKALSKVDEIAEATRGIQGVYEITTKSGKKYVGKSKDVAKRLKQHKKSAKFSGADEIADVKVTEVIGSPLDLAVHEQKTLDNVLQGQTVSEAYKNGAVLNKINAVGPARAGEMGRTVTTGKTFGQ
ncbi:MAG: GIY-YIG nuclease family protein [Chitinophagales bacterium]|nr:GIY-YIG nuclease family protein [Chitinophagales bacterium]